MSSRTSDRYREKAKECREIAEAVLSPLELERWLLLASEWLRMAEDGDAKKPPEGG